MACFDGAADKAFAIAVHADDPIEPPGCGGRAAGLPVQLAGGGSQFTHLASGKNAPSGGRRAHQNFDHRLKRNWIRVVAIVDHRSEERRVGEEGRSRWAPYHSKKKKIK